MHEQGDTHTSHFLDDSATSLEDRLAIIDVDAETSRLRAMTADELDRMSDVFRSQWKPLRSAVDRALQRRKAVGILAGTVWAAFCIWIAWTITGQIGFRDDTTSEAAAVIEFVAVYAALLVLTRLVSTSAVYLSTASDCAGLSGTLLRAERNARLLCDATLAAKHEARS